MREGAIARGHHAARHKTHEAFRSGNSQTPQQGAIAQQSATNTGAEIPMANVDSAPNNSTGCHAGRGCQALSMKNPAELTVTGGRRVLYLSLNSR